MAAATPGDAIAPTKKRDFRRKAATLGVLVVIGLTYCVVLFRGLASSDHPRAEGLAGIVIGLYICSHPAANLIDLLFYRRTSLRQPTSGWLGAGWLSLNAVALLTGWLVLTVGIARLAIRVG